MASAYHEYLWIAMCLDSWCCLFEQIRASDVECTRTSILILICCGCLEEGYGYVIRFWNIGSRLQVKIRLCYIILEQVRSDEISNRL